MTNMPSKQQFLDIAEGYHLKASSSHTLRAEAYIDPCWHQVDQQEIIAKSWQWVCHVEKVREPNAYVAIDIAGQPIAIVRDGEGVLRAFYNVCKHRGHQLLFGEGTTKQMICPYHAWVYQLDGQLARARNTKHLDDFDPAQICLDEVQIEEFCGFVYVNLDPNASPLAEQSGGLEADIRNWAPEIDQLTFAHRLTYDIKSNWKNVVDNFLECYHCPVAHKAFCELVEMNTYETSTYGIYSSQIADAGNNPNGAYDVSSATFKKQVVWWLWPNTCLIRFPGRPNFIVLHIIPAGPDRTLETLDFFFETPAPNEAELDAIRFFDDVLQVEDIGLVESVQRGMGTPAFDQGRIVVDPNELGKSEHAVHHFHGLVLDNYSKVAGSI